MEKISGIIPRNSRNSNADLSKSQPVRPGAPSFGRPMGKVTTRTYSEAVPETTNETTKDIAKEIVKDTFFVDNKKLNLPAIEENQIEDKITISAEIKELKSLKAETDEIESEVFSRALAKYPKSITHSESEVKANFESKPNASQYNKKGETIKVAIAEEVSKKFNNLEA